MVEIGESWVGLYCIGIEGTAGTKPRSVILGEASSSVSGDQAETGWDGEVAVAPGMRFWGKSAGVSTTAVCGLMTTLESEGIAKPIIMGREPGDKSPCGDDSTAGLSAFLPLVPFRLSQANVPIDSSEGEPSRALRAARSTNLPVRVSRLPGLCLVW